jgi:two-component system, NtrC family, sensor histidine kinase HydH
MTIRRTLLLAFLLVGVTPALVLAVLAFNRASHALQVEIEQGLAAQAEALASAVDKLMHERLQNAATWSRLEVMQDLQVADVDKRLSAFLQRLQRGYGGMYRELSVVDRQDRVVASSEAGRIGQLDAVTSEGQTLRLGEASIRLDRSTHDGSLCIRTDIESAFGNGRLGELRLRFDGGQLDSLLEQAADGSRLVALLDDQGRLVAGSRNLVSRLQRGSVELAGWPRPMAAGSTVVDGRAPLPAEALIVGSGPARGLDAAASAGWQVLVLVPRHEALAPVRSMALIFVALLAGVALLTVAVAGGVSQAIARPIATLTAFTRRYKAGGLEPPPPPLSGEVGELRDAFVQMVGTIEQSQQRLAQASALAAVGEMSAVIAHEVRTPLGILRSSSQVLLRESGLSDEGRELLGFIESETARINGLVSQMLDSARPRPPNLVPTDVNELVRRSVLLLGAQAQRKGVQFTLQLQATAPDMMCDPEQMTQVLLNLVLNGLQMLSDGGRVVVGTHDDASQLVIEVADDGPGIAPAARARIFEAFFFQREGGIGLGLAVVQRIVASHGGDIEAGQSALGGALFRIRLPRNVTP